MLQYKEKYNKFKDVIDLRDILFENKIKHHGFVCIFIYSFFFGKKNKEIRKILRFVFILNLKKPQKIMI